MRWLLSMQRTNYKHDTADHLFMKTISSLTAMTRRMLPILTGTTQVIALIFLQHSDSWLIRRWRSIPGISRKGMLRLCVLAARIAAYHIHKAVGFREIGKTDEIIHIEMTRVDYLKSSGKQGCIHSGDEAFIDKLSQ